jgi:hypothetical protein
MSVNIATALKQIKILNTQFFETLPYMLSLQRTGEMSHIESNNTHSIDIAIHHVRTWFHVTWYGSPEEFMS